LPSLNCNPPISFSQVARITGFHRFLNFSMIGFYFRFSDMIMLSRRKNMINDFFCSFYLAKMYCCNIDTTPQNWPQRNRHVIACDDAFFFPLKAENQLEIVLGRHRWFSDDIWDDISSLIDDSIKECRENKKNSFSIW
jgi:hypothetical protein